MYNNQCTVSVSFEEPEPIVHDSDVEPEGSVETLVQFKWTFCDM